MNRNSGSDEELIGSTESNDDFEISLKISVHSSNNLNVRDRVEVMWPDDGSYYAGTTFLHNTNDYKHTTDFDDSDTEYFVVSTET